MESLFAIFKTCLQSDRNSQRWLYESYYGYALKIAYRYAENYDNARMIANDSFVKAFKNLSQFELTDNETVLELRFKGWLRRIVINTSIDQSRKKNPDAITGALEEDCWELSDPSEKSDSKLLYKELICYLKELPPGYQKVFNLFVIDGYSHAEIAALLGISVGTSKSNLSRAKEILQKNLSEFFETKAL